MLEAGRTAIVDAAREIRGDTAALGGPVASSVLDRRPELGVPDRRELFEAALAGNLDTGLRMFELGQRPDSVAVDPAQVDWATQVARSDVPVTSVLDAYRVGQSAFLGIWNERVATHLEKASDLAEVYRTSAESLDHYVTRAASTVERAFTLERDHWDRGHGDEMNSLVRVLTAADGESAPAKVNGYSLAGLHLALVIVPADARHPVTAQQARSVVTSMSHALAARESYLIAADGCCWAWLLDPRVTSNDEVRRLIDEMTPPTARVAVGRRGRGVTGFVRGHHEALRLAAMLHRFPGRAWTYDGLEIPVLTGADSRGVRDFVESELGALAGPGAANETLRETLRVYLDEMGSARRTAERLYLHRNSVVYRIKNAETLVGGRVAERQLRLQLALHLIDSPLLQHPG